MTEKKVHPTSTSSSLSSSSKFPEKRALYESQEDMGKKGKKKKTTSQSASSSSASQPKSSSSSSSGRDTVNTETEPNNDTRATAGDIFQRRLKLWHEKVPRNRFYGPTKMFNTILHNLDIPRKDSEGKKDLRIMEETRMYLLSLTPDLPWQDVPNSSQPPAQICKFTPEASKNYAHGIIKLEGNAFLPDARDWDCDAQFRVLTGCIETDMQGEKYGRKSVMNEEVHIVAGTGYKITNSSNFQPAFLYFRYRKIVSPEEHY